MEDYKDSGLYAKGIQMVAIGSVLMNPNSTMEDLIRVFHNSGFGLDFRLVFRDIEGEDDGSC